MEHGHLADQLHDLRFHQALFLKVPLGTFKVETCDESTIFDDFRNVSNCLLSRNEIEFKSINGWGSCLSGELLKERSGETSGVGEVRDVENERCTLLSPQLEELVSGLEVSVPRTERLHREVSVAPGLWHKVVIQVCHHIFKIGRDNDNTLDTLFELITRNSHDVEKDVVTLNFLNQNDSKRTVIFS